MRYVRRFPIAPMLLALYAVLTLLANNIDQISGSQSIRSLVISLIAAAVLIGAFMLAFKDWHRAALAAFLVVLLFFSYGHVYGSSKQVQISSILIGRHRFLIPLWIGLLALGMFWVSRRLQDPAPLSGILNLVAGILILVPLSTILIFLVRSRSIQFPSEPQSLGNCDLTVPVDSRAPDIYYIILDAYARADDLLEVYQFDNSDFLEGLRGMGFYVAEWSQSNYTSTHFSVTSSLKMDYLQSLDESIYDGAPFDVAPLWPLLGDNAARRNLECIGYKVVAFDSGWHALGWRDADVYISSVSTSFAEALELSGGINAFESMLIHSSAAMVLTDAATIMPKFLEIDTSEPFRDHRLRMLYLLDSLERVVPAIEGPKFVFAHILITHKPYVFGPNGEEIELGGPFTFADTDTDSIDDQEKTRYRDQITFINMRIENIIREILEVSETPPVIILQSDHGSGMGRRLSILNAYFLPNGGDQLLYDTISPVNTFRVVFNSYLSGDYVILDDISYSSAYESYDFSVVPNEHSTN